MLSNESTEEAAPPPAKRGRVVTNAFRRDTQSRPTNPSGLPSRDDRLIMAMEKSNQMMMDQLKAITESNAATFQQIIGLMHPQQASQQPSTMQHEPQHYNRYTDNSHQSPHWQSPSIHGNYPHQGLWQPSQSSPATPTSNNPGRATHRPSIIPPMSDGSFVRQLDEAQVPGTSAQATTRLYDLDGITDY